MSEFHSVGRASYESNTKLVLLILCLYIIIFEQLKRSLSRNLIKKHVCVDYEFVRYIIYIHIHVSHLPKLIL